MKRIITLSAGLLFLLSCRSKQQAQKESETPACIKKAVESFSKTDCQKNPNVKEYTFQGKHVFVFDPGRCGADMTSDVLDSDCKPLGALGGFIGNVKINGEDFSNAVFIRTIWER